MATKERYKGTIIREMQTVPFETTEEAWFWFIQAQQARIDGARFVSGLGLVPRPCEPVDILNILNRMHRSRRLLWEHLLVLRYYGQRNLPPDAQRLKEARAYRLWAEAMERLEPVFTDKGIVREKTLFEQMRRNALCLESKYAEYKEAAE